MNLENLPIHLTKPTMFRRRFAPPDVLVAARPRAEARELDSMVGYQGAGQRAR